MSKKIKPFINKVQQAKDTNLAFFLKLSLKKAKSNLNESPITFDGYDEDGNTYSGFMMFNGEGNPDKIIDVNIDVLENNTTMSAGRMSEQQAFLHYQSFKVLQWLYEDISKTLEMFESNPDPMSQSIFNKIKTVKDYFPSFETYHNHLQSMLKRHAGIFMEREDDQLWLVINEGKE